MAFIGNEIVQSRTWIDPKAKPIDPTWNYKYAFPITVFDAVRESMCDENSQTLRQALDYIKAELATRQTIVPNLPANYLMTYAGAVGQIGSIEISHKIPWDKEQRSHFKIPTEKAVGDLLEKVGLIDSSGKPIDPDSQTIQWSNIIGRPNAYHELGDHDDGFVTQDVITKVFDAVRSEIDQLRTNSGGNVNSVLEQLNLHLSEENPHHITPSMIGAASDETFQLHLRSPNPHGINPEIIGLGEVDNTSDEDKPLSKAARDALQTLKRSIEEIGSRPTDTSNCLVDITYNRSSGKLVARLKDGSEIVLDIPINGLIDDIRYDKSSRMLLVYDLSGERRQLDLSNLIYKCIGSRGSSVNVTIEDQEDGIQVVKAEILPRSITAEMLSPDINLGGDFTIADLSITTKKLADGSVTTEKIRDRSISSSKFVPGAVDGKALFTSNKENQVLMVRKAGSEPLWGQIVSDLIVDHAIKTRHLTNWSVVTDTIADHAVTSDKLEDQSVGSDQLKDGSIGGSKLVWNITLPGTPTGTITPDKDAEGHELVDASWVRSFIQKFLISKDNIGRRIIDGEKLFSSENGDEVLVVEDPDSNPVWKKLSGKFLEDQSITSEKIVNEAIHSRHIPEGEISPRELFPSERPYRVLGVGSEPGHPKYFQIVREMLQENIIGTKEIENGSVTLSKLQSSDEDYKILATRLRGSVPEWTQVVSKMIADRSIYGRHLFTSEENDTVLIAEQAGGNPKWGKIKGEMIRKLAITSEHIVPGAIKAIHLADDIFSAMTLKDRSVTTEKIQRRAVTGSEIFSSPIPDTVLAVPKIPYVDPQWTKVTGAMIADKSIGPEKLATSSESFRVFGVRTAGDNPEFMKIGREFLEDHTIDSTKLAPDLELLGEPTLSKTLASDIDGKKLVNAEWVRQHVQYEIEHIPEPVCGCEEFKQLTEEALQDIWNGLRPDIPDETGGILDGMDEEDVLAIWNSTEDLNYIYPTDGCECGDLEEASIEIVKDAWDDVLHDFLGKHPHDEHYITGKEIFTSENTGVLAVTTPNSDAEWTKIGKDLLEDEAVNTDKIADSSVTSEKLADDIQLNGRPTLKERPPAGASDIAGVGTLIPDCQWVLDRIQDAVNNLSGCPCNNQWIEILHDAILEEWNNGGEGDLTAAKDEITSQSVEEIWADPGTDDLEFDEDELNDEVIRKLWLNPDDDSVGSPDWKAIDPTAVESEYQSPGGDEEADADEINAEQVAFEWETKGSSPVASEIGEISQATVISEWDQKGIDSGEIEPDDGTFPGSGCGCTPGQKLEEGSVKNEHLADGSVNGQKMFTSMEPGVLAVKQKVGIPEWSKITKDLMAPGSVGTEQIEDGSITPEKLAEGSVDFSKVDPSTIKVDSFLNPSSIHEEHLQDSSVTTAKIQDQAVDNSKITNHTITGEKLVDGIQLPADTQVAGTKEFEERAVRNIILSPNAPKNARNGDIWFRYY